MVVLLVPHRPFGGAPVTPASVGSAVTGYGLRGVCVALSTYRGRPSTSSPNANVGVL